MARLLQRGCHTTARSKGVAAEHLHSTLFGARTVPRLELQAWPKQSEANRVCASWPQRTQKSPRRLPELPLDKRTTVLRSRLKVATIQSFNVEDCDPTHIGLHDILLCRHHNTPNKSKARTGDSRARGQGLGTQPSTTEREKKRKKKRGPSC